MKTFEEWLIHNHPEVLEEGWRRNLGALALAGASLLPVGAAHAAKPAQASQSASQSERARLDAMERVSQVESGFWKNWGSEFGTQTKLQLFDLILKLKTDEDHDDFIAKISADMEKFVRNGMIGRNHPDKSVEKDELKNLMRSYDYQYMNYLKTLAFASKINL
jgi:hypothetical protein